MEEWRDIQGYEGLYQVSNEGRVKSLEREIMRSDGKTLPLKEKILKPNLNNSSRHYQVLLCENGIEKWKQVHQIVAQTFIPNPNGCDVVHHKDHNPQNNRVENLMWMSKEEHDAIHRAEQAKTIYQYTIQGELIAVYSSAYEAARELRFSQGNITMCCQGKRKTHKGYKWSYKPL